MKGFRFAWNGLSYAFRTQINFRFHCLAVLIVAGAGVYFDLSTNEWLWLSLAVTLVICAELFNTAIETFVDFVSPEFNIKAGLVKDLAAASVLITAIFALLTAVMIFVPRICDAS